MCFREKNEFHDRSFHERLKQFLPCFNSVHSDLRGGARVLSFLGLWRETPMPRAVSARPTRGVPREGFFTLE